MLKVGSVYFPFLIWRKRQQNSRSLALGNRLEEISFMRSHRSRLRSQMERLGKYVSSQRLQPLVLRGFKH